MRKNAPRGWLLLRGLGREVRHWFDFPERLAGATGAACQALDLPGAGVEAHRESPTTIRAIAKDVLSRFHAQYPPGTPGNWGLLGLSLGGMVALEMARLSPQSFSHVALVNSSSTLSPPQKRMRPKALLRLTLALSQRSALRREQHIYALTAASCSAFEYAIPAAAFHETAPMHPKSIVNQLRAAAAFGPPGHLEQHCLVIRARGDRLVCPSCSERLAKHLQAELVEHPSAGHDLACDDPEWLAARLSGWARVR